MSEVSGPRGGGERQDLVLDQYMPYRLSVVANAVSALVSSAYKDQYQLSVWEWRVIAVLGGVTSLTAQGICQKTAMDKVTVSRAINRLLKRGILQRAVSAGDRRSHDVSLTQEGVEIYRAIVPSALKCESDLLTVLTPGEQGQLFDLLEKLETAVRILAVSVGAVSVPNRVST